MMNFYSDSMTLHEEFNVTKTWQNAAISVDLSAAEGSGIERYIKFLSEEGIMVSCFSMAISSTLKWVTGSDSMLSIS